MVEPALVLPPTRDDRWQLARQMDVSKAVIHPLEIGDGRTEWSLEDLQALVASLAAADLEFAVLEGSVPITEEIRLGLPGRDADIAAFKRFIRDCGEAGIPVICYDWMAGIRWARTATDVPSRGGAYVSEFDATAMTGTGPEAAVAATHEDLWEALEYFLAEVIPVAEDAGVRLGLHPDDPPRESVGGVPRIIGSVEAYDRLLEIEESPANGITFCQGNFTAMGADIPDAVERFGDRIVFVHFRDVRGDEDAFVETWHDDGPTDMLAAMAAYEQHVSAGTPMRPDHVPTMAGEDNSNPMYHTSGRLFAIGYMRGLREQLQ
jgi:mannonate dehydratase